SQTSALTEYFSVTAYTGTNGTPISGDVYDRLILALKENLIGTAVDVNPNGTIDAINTIVANNYQAASSLNEYSFTTSWGSNTNVDNDTKVSNSGVLAGITDQAVGAFISGNRTVNLTETDAALTTSGTVTSTDVDGVVNAFTAETVQGTYGSLVMGASGAWTYTAASAQNQLAAGATATDTFTIHAADSTASSITVKITGTNDAAVISSSTVNLTDTFATITQNVVLTFTNTSIDSSATNGTEVLNGTLTLQQTFTGDYSVVGGLNKFTITDTHVDSIQAINLTTSGGTGSQLKLNNKTFSQTGSMLQKSDASNDVNGAGVSISDNVSQTSALTEYFSVTAYTGTNGTPISGDVYDRLIL
ncbi:MAG: hypothetical protein EBT78_18810, partial [Betaproteobacteria bacterium]|nr:hypothetical protein [Betaproteobacteria bacterium]